jgi:outer membrane protein
MKRKLYFILPVFLFSFSLPEPMDAQTKWSLSDCIQYALDHNLDIKRQQTEIDRQAIQQQTNSLSRLPNVMAGSTQKFDFGRSLNRDNTYNDVNSQNSAFSLSTETSLFEGLKTVHTIERQKIELKVHQTNLDKIKNNLSMTIAVNYFQILLNKEILEIAKEQITLSRELEDITIMLASHGKIASSQVYDVRAQISNDELSATKAQNTLLLSIVDLIQMLELEEVDAFDIQNVQKEMTTSLIQNPDEVYAFAKQSMPEIKSAALSVESSERAIKIAQAAYYPSLSFAAGLNSNYYHFSNADNISFSSQINNNLQKTVYLSLRIPIFNKFSTRNRVREARKNWEESRLIAEQSNKTLYKEIQKAYYDALSAQEKYHATEKAVDANSEAMRYALEKYNAGRFTAYEYNEVKLKLANSLSEQAQAKYEWMLQKMLLDFYSGIPIH